MNFKVDYKCLASVIIYAQMMWEANEKLESVVVVKNEDGYLAMRSKHGLHCHTVMAEFKARPKPIKSYVMQKMTKFDIQEILFASKSEEVIFKDGVLDYACLGIVQSIERESGCGRCFNIKLLVDGGKNTRSIFIRIS